VVLVGSQVQRTTFDRHPRFGDHHAIVVLVEDPSPAASDRVVGWFGLIRIATVDPYGVDAEVAQVTETRPHAGDVARAVAERSNVDLVHHRSAPP